MVETVVERKERLSVADFLERAGRDEEFLDYWVQRGLPVGRAGAGEAAYLDLPAVARYLRQRLRLELAQRVDIPLGEVLRTGEWRAPTLPKTWSERQLAEFLRVERAQVAEWTRRGLLEEHEGRFPTREVLDFLRVSEMELAYSLPKTFTINEIREMGVPESLLQEGAAGELDGGGQPVLLLTRDVGEIFVPRGVVVRFSKLYVWDYMFRKGLKDWLEVLQRVPELREWILIESGQTEKPVKKEVVRTTSVEKRQPKAMALRKQEPQGMVIQGRLLEIPAEPPEEAANLPVAPEQVWDVLDATLRKSIESAVIGNWGQVGSYLFAMLDLVARLKRLGFRLTREEERPEPALPARVEPEPPPVVKTTIEERGWKVEPPYVQMDPPLKGEPSHHWRTKGEYVLQILDRLAEYAREGRFFSKTGVTQTDFGWSLNARFRVYVVVHILEQLGWVKDHKFPNRPSLQLLVGPEEIRALRDYIARRLQEAA